MYPSLVVFSFLMRLIFMLVLGAIGMGIASGSSRKLSFAGAIRLAAIVMTPVIVIDTMFWIAHISGGCLWFFAAMAVEIVLMIFAVRANPTTDAAIAAGYGVGGFGPPVYGAPGYPQVQAPQQQQQQWPPPGAR